MLAARSSKLAARSGTSSKRSVAVRATSRPLWLPNTQAPAHLSGQLPGDSGFDPLVR